MVSQRYQSTAVSISRPHACCYDWRPVPFVQADVDALDAAYKSGALVIRTADGRTHTLRTVDEYLRLRGLILAEIAEAAGMTVNRLVKVGHASGVA